MSLRPFASCSTKLGGSDQALLREVFAGELQEKIQCRECGEIKVREETFTDLVLPAGAHFRAGQREWHRADHAEPSSGALEVRRDGRREQFGHL